jgi:hypothetical protein
MRITLNTTLKVLTSRGAGILDGVLAAILYTRLQNISVSTTQVSLTIFDMWSTLLLSISVVLLTCYILLYKRLKLVSFYLKVQRTSWEEVENTVEFTNAWNEAVKEQENKQV